MEREFASNVDVIVLGAGAAGMMRALTAAQRGRPVLLLDHSEKLAEKIRISGGGRCNFTNLTQSRKIIFPVIHISAVPRWRVLPRNISSRCWISMAFTTTKKRSDNYSATKARKPLSRCSSANVMRLACAGASLATYKKSIPIAQAIEGQREMDSTTRFILSTSRGQFHTHSLVIATGGLSIPKIGATPFGHKIAQQFGIPVTKLKPGLVPLSFHPEEWAAYAELAGISVDAVVSYGKQSFRENLLFTHRGLSGPAILQISSYWEHGNPLSINLLPDHDMRDLFAQQRGSRMLLSNFIAQYLPRRFADVWCGQLSGNKPLNQYSEKTLLSFAAKLHGWQIAPTGTLGYNKAEVTCGGLDTHALSSRPCRPMMYPACISSVKWWMSPGNSAVITFSGRGHPAMWPGR